MSLAATSNSTTLDSSAMLNYYINNNNIKII
jgi:hypothetical protein